MEPVTTNQVKEMIDQLAAMTAAASITPEIVASIFEKMRNLNDQEREKVIKVATEYIEEIKTTGIQADKVHLNSGSNAEAEIDALITEVFPLKASIEYSNAGSYEVGTKVVPYIELSITRRGNDVAPSATLGCSDPEALINQETKSVTCAEISSGTKTVALRVAQGGQEVKLEDQKYEFMNYMYRGPVASAPTQATILSIIKSLPKTLSTSTKLSQTTLAGGSYYVFAVKGTPNLVVHNAKSGGVVDSYAKGTISVPQENDESKTNTYSYVVVPKSSSTWYFTIENS